MKGRNVHCSLFFVNMYDHLTASPSRTVGLILSYCEISANIVLSTMLSKPVGVEKYKNKNKNVKPGW